MKKLIAKLEDYPGYFISNKGDVFSNKIKISIGGCGIKSVSGDKLYKLKPTVYNNRLFVTLSNGAKSKRMRVHRLIAKAFIPNPECKPQVNHKNGNPLDNRIENLYWGTQKENILDAVRHGTFISLVQRGEKNPSSKLSNEKVKLIRLLYNDFKWKPIKIYRIFGGIYGVSQRNFYSIIQNQIWKYV